MSTDFQDPRPAPESFPGPVPESFPAQFPGPFPGPEQGPQFPPTAPASRSRGRKATFTALWLVSALAVGTGSGFGILKATEKKDSGTAAFSPVSVGRPAPSATSVPSGVRADGTHFGSVQDFLLPMPSGFHAGPDDGEFGNDVAITPQQMDAQVGQMFPGLQQSDMTSAKGAMEAAHMKDGALRTYTNDSSTIIIIFTALQLDPSMAAKSTSDFMRIVKASSSYRNGPVVAGHADARCVLPATRPGDKIDEMICLGTVGDTFVMGEATGTVPMDQNVITGMFAKQLDVLRKGPVAK